MRWLLLVLVCTVALASAAPTPHTVLAIAYPAGWNLVSGPEGSHLRGASGPIYTLQAGDVDYQTLPANTALTGCVGYWAYFPTGGSLIAAADTAQCTIPVQADRWSLVGNPSATTDAQLSGVESALAYSGGTYQPVTALAPGQGAWAYGSGSGSVTVTAPATQSGVGAVPQPAGEYPLHTGITATVFWVGEPVSDGSSEDNSVSVYDGHWLQHYGCDEQAPGPAQYTQRRLASARYFPAGCTPNENPFYLDLPYSDVDINTGAPKPDRMSVAPWSGSGRDPGPSVSLMKNVWVELTNPATGRTCYGQNEDAGPYVYDDVVYVFGAGNPRPRNRRAHGAGMDVSPALRDCLGFREINGSGDMVDWQFVAASAVPDGPWLIVLTRSPLQQ